MEDQIHVFLCCLVLDELLVVVYAPFEEFDERIEEIDLGGSLELFIMDHNAGEFLKGEDRFLSGIIFHIELRDVIVLVEIL